MRDNERFFSVELESKANLKNITLTNDSDDGVLVEGTIGELVGAAFTEGIILEIIGRSGTLRINLKPSELKKASRASTAGKSVAARKNSLEEVI